jgi:chromosome segregation ATPase
MIHADIHIKFEIQVPCQQLGESRRDLAASDRDLEGADQKLRTLRAEFDLKEESLQGKTNECQDLEVNLSTTNQQANEEPPGICVECQDIQQTKEALNEQLLEANKKCQSLGAETQELRNISELQEAQPQSLREELVAASKKLQDANQTNEVLNDEVIPT